MFDRILKLPLHAASLLTVQLRLKLTITYAIVKYL